MTEEDRSHGVWKSLADAKLVQIEVEEFPERIREVKQIAIGHLGKLLQKDAGPAESRSVAHALGTLSRLEANLRADAKLQKSGPSQSPSAPKRSDEQR